MSEGLLKPGCCPRRRWGRSGLDIPVIPFGTQGFGNHFGPVSDEQAMGLIRRAVDLGVNHFDCARCTDYFDAVLIHDPKAIEPTLAPGGCLEGLKALKAKGVVRNVGYGMRPHDFHLRAIEAGEIDVLLTFNDYNLFGQGAAEDILPAAADRGIGVLNGWSIKRGLLTGTPVERLVPRDKWAPGSEPERAERMRLWCVERGVSLLQLALQFCLREGRIHGNPIGSLNIEQLEMNVSAVLEPLPERIFEDFRAAGL